MAKNYKKRTTEEIRQETNELTNQALESVENFTKSPESMKELMDFMSKFPERSFRNQVLIQKQFPGAQACLGRAALKTHNIFIKKGEKGNKIFVRKTVKGFYDKNRGFVREAYATKEDRSRIEKGEIKIERKPYYSIEKVFDVSQTQLKPEDYPKVFPNRVFDFNLDEKGQSELKQGISAVAKEMGIEIKDMREGNLYRGELGSAKGAYVHDPITGQEEIVLNSRNTGTHNLSTSIHELAHAKLHKQSDLPLPIKELQAEMTSYVVNKHFGMDTSEKSIPYIAGWTNNGAALNTLEPAERGKILNDVSRAANQFVQTISAEINQQREIELEINSEQNEIAQEKKEERAEDKPDKDKMTTEFVDLAIKVAHSHEVGNEGRTTEVISNIVNDFKKLHEFYQEHSDQIHNNDVTIPIAEKINSVSNIEENRQILVASKGISEHCNYPPLNENILWNESMLNGSDHNRNFLNQSVEMIDSFKEWEKVQTLSAAEKVSDQFKQLNDYYKANQDSIKYDHMNGPIIDKFSTVFDWKDTSDVLNSISQASHKFNTEYIRRRLENHSLESKQPSEHRQEQAPNTDSPVSEKTAQPSVNDQQTSKEKESVEEIPLDGTAWINRNTGKVSHADTGRCLPLKDGKYTKTQDQVQLSGKVFNKEISTSLTKDHFFSGYPFRFPKEQINQIQDERKNLVAAEQQKQMERA